MYIGQNFSVTISPFSIPIPSTITLNLLCASSPTQSYSIVQIWTSVVIGSSQQLLASGSLSAPASCYLQTPSNDPYFNQATGSILPIFQRYCELYIPSVQTGYMTQFKKFTN